jgi:hypothetical protein
MGLLGTHLEPHALLGQPSMVFWIVCIINYVRRGVHIRWAGEVLAGGGGHGGSCFFTVPWRRSRKTETLNATGSLHAEGEHSGTQK